MLSNCNSNKIVLFLCVTLASLWEHHGHYENINLIIRTLIIDQLLELSLIQLKCVVSIF